MEMALNMGSFEALDNSELFTVVGGSKEAAALVLIFGGAVAAGFLAPLTCGGSLAAYAGVAIAGYGAMGSGVALLV